MALTKCAECGKEISTDAKTCPHCGTTKPHKIKPIQALFVAIVFIIITVVFFNSDFFKSAKDENKTDSLTKSSTDSEKPLMTDKELAVYKALIRSDMHVLVDGGESMTASTGIISPLPLIISSKKLQLAYEKNEVAADQQYKNKMVSITGTVDSIDKSFTDSIMIGLRGGSNQFIHPMASIDKKYEQWSASLNKGDKVSMVCTVTGMTMGAAYLESCIPSYTWADDTAEKIIQSTKEGIDKKNKFFIGMVIVSKKMAEKLNDNSKCFNGDNLDECVKELNNIKITDMKMTDEEKKSIASMYTK